MKTTFLWLVGATAVASAMGCGDDITASSDRAAWRHLPADSTAVAVIVVDSQTLHVAGANVRVYPPCDGCSADRIPFVMDYRAPGDFGGIRFDLEGSGGVVFEASIIWMGTGGILQPPLPLHERDFTRMAPVEPFPDDLQYLGPWPDQSIDAWRQTARAAWPSVGALDVVRRFAHRPGHRFGLYVYQPGAGGNDRNQIRWVFFLYAPAVP